MCAGAILALLLAMTVWLSVLYLASSGGEVPLTPVVQSPPVTEQQDGVSIVSTALSMIIAFAVIIAAPLIFFWAVRWLAKTYSRLLHAAARRLFGGRYTVRQFQLVKIAVFALSTFSTYVMCLLYPAGIFFAVFLGAVLCLAVALVCIVVQTVIAFASRRQVSDVL